MVEDLRSLVPRGKGDIEGLRRLIGLGLPKITPVLPDIVSWIQDINWPIAYEAGLFLSSVGRPLLPIVRDILQTDDEVWKFNVLTIIVEDWSQELLEELRPELERIERSPTAGELDYGVLPAVATELLDKIRAS